MKLLENTPTRKRVIQGDIYLERGIEDHAFDMYRPFTEEDFVHLREKYGVDPAGFANQANQVLTENLGNTLAARIKKAAEKDEDLPTQDDLLEMYEDYDFSGIRASGGGAASLTPMEKALNKFSRQVIRAMLKENGYGEMDAPVTVAKREDEPGENQISYDVFDAEVESLANGEGPWAEDEDMIALRREHVVEPAEALVAAEAKSKASVAVRLGLAG